MAIAINGSGTMTGISVGGLPDGIVDSGTLATNSVDSAELIDGAIDSSHLNTTSTGINSSANAVAITISADEEVQMPLQPCFCGTEDGINNVTGDGTSYTIIFDNERFDQSGDFDGTTFTAPVTGKYLLSYQVGLHRVAASSDVIQTTLVTSNLSYNNTWGKTDSIWANHTLCGTVVCDMDASDTAHVYVYVAGAGGDTADLEGGGYTYFSGVLIA